MGLLEWMKLEQMERERNLKPELRRMLTVFSGRRKISGEKNISSDYERPKM